MTRGTRRYALTLNNPTEEEKQCILNLALKPEVVKRAIFSEEVADSGTPHIQGYVNLKNTKSLKAIKKYLGSDRWHVERAIGTCWENWQYCSKDLDGAEPFLRLGDSPKEEGDPSDWERILEMVENGASMMEIIRRFPGQAIRCQSAISKLMAQIDLEQAEWRDVEVSYLWGKTGSGKTSMIYKAHGYQDVYRATNKKNPWDMYTGQPVVVFEEFRNSYDIADMLNWLDGHPITLPARYADRIAQFTTVYIVSNWELEEQYSNLQVRSPETWKAFNRRIDHVVEVRKKSSKIDIA